MKELTLLFIIFIITGCTVVTNGDEIQASLDRCKMIFKEECAMVALPLSAEPKVKLLLGEILQEDSK